MLQCDRLIKLRKEKKLIQQGMADFLKITRTAYNKYENGKSQPPSDTIVMLSSYFGVSTDYLLGNTDNPTPPSAKKEAPAYEGFDSDTLLAFYGGVKEHLSQDDLDEIKTIMELKAKRNKEKKNDESGRNNL